MSPKYKKTVNAGLLCLVFVVCLVCTATEDQEDVESDDEEDEELTSENIKEHVCASARMGQSRYDKDQNQDNSDNFDARQESVKRRLKKAMAELKLIVQDQVGLMKEFIVNTSDMKKYHLEEWNTCVSLTEQSSGLLNSYIDVLDKTPHADTFEE
ncbi:hypothetical protein DPEC_G00163670 [Dallia pectoralis]|uniref:Uncharacterized protein n=1 Tax=Dallia pectoralis TaxID=75939 RepID=A0ACC2GH90_DALPE|nr:hypothetical protein DPEC_G00163670 [Dallia pectoralis]